MCFAVKHPGPGKTDFDKFISEKLALSNLPLELWVINITMFSNKFSKEWPK
jgi:hypothetical protein